MLRENLTRIEDVGEPMPTGEALEVVEHKTVAWKRPTVLPSLLRTFPVSTLRIHLRRPAGPVVRDSQ